MNELNKNGAVLDSHSVQMGRQSLRPVNESAMTGNKRPLLRAEMLRRQVGEKMIVREASLALRSGEVVAITGPSGAGKSSVLRLLNRLDAPTAGRVLLEGADTAKWMCTSCGGGWGW